MLYCPECGAVLSDDAQFCYRCKTRIATHLEGNEKLNVVFPDIEYDPVRTDAVGGDAPAEADCPEPEKKESAEEMIGQVENDVPFGADAETADAEETRAEDIEVTATETETDVPDRTDADGVLDPVANAEKELFNMLEELRRAAGMDIQSVQDELKKASEVDPSASDEREADDGHTQPEPDPVEPADNDQAEADPIKSFFEFDADDIVGAYGLDSLIQKQPLAEEAGDGLFDSDFDFDFDAADISDEPEQAVTDRDLMAEKEAVNEPEKPIFVFDAVGMTDQSDLEKSSSAETESGAGHTDFTFEARETAAGEEIEEYFPDETVMPENENGESSEEAEQAAGTSVETADEPQTVDAADAAEQILDETAAEPVSELAESVTEDIHETETAAKEESAETELPKFVFDDYDDDDTYDELQDAAAEAGSVAGKGLQAEEDVNRSAVVRALYSRELTVDKPIRTDELVSEKPASIEARKRKRNSLIAVLALALVISLAAVYYHNLPGNVYSRHMKKAEAALSQGDVSVAAVEYNKALEIRPDSLQASEVLDSLWSEACSKADVLADEGKFSDAVAAAQDLKLIHPQDSSGFAEEMEKIYSSWAYSAALSGRVDEVSRILEMSKNDVGSEAYSRIETLAREGQARASHAGVFSETSEKILDNFFGGNRLAVFDIMNGIKSDIASYMNEGGSFPFISEEERAGRHVAYYGNGDTFQVYIGKLTDEDSRIGTADSFVISSGGSQGSEYEYYTCEWDKDVPGGNFTDVRYGGSLEEAKYTYSGKLKDGAYDGDIDVTESDGTVYKTKFENGKVILEMEVSPGGARNVVGWDEYRVWMLCFSDEDVQRVFALPYVE